MHSGIQFSETRSAFIERALEPAGQAIHVVGLGKFGGNLALIQWLVEGGHEVILWERGQPEDLEDSWCKLKACHQNIKVHWGEAAPRLPDHGPVFLTPGVPPNVPYLQNVSVENRITEIEIAIWKLSRINAKIHVVLGSVAKSTCAELLALALGAKAFGNIGRSCLSEPTLPAELVMELSSFQLHYLKHSGFVPSGFVFTELLDHHSDWHGGIEAYHRAKLDWVELWSEKIPGVKGEDVPVGVKAPFVTHAIMPKKNLDLVWQYLLNIDRANDLAVENMKSFQGLEHRMELTEHKNACRFINDSKSTHPVSTLNAISQIRPGSVLVLQGKNVNKDFSEVFDTCRSESLRVYAVGECAENFMEKGMLVQENCFERLDDLFESGRLSGLNECDVLFSPGAPSYDLYSNYEERGRHFKSLAHALVEGRIRTK